MKKLLFTLTGIIMLNFANAQAFTHQGDQKLQVGLSAYGYGSGLKGSYDYGINHLFSAGAGAEVYFDNDDDKEGGFHAFVRGSIHTGELLGMPDNMDLYPGIDMGINENGLGLGAYVGFRYFINNQLGFYAELGSRGAFGISINL